LEVASIVAFFAAMSVLGERIVAGAEDGLDWLGIGVSVLGGYLAADFISGFAHWAGDTVCDETTPFLGPNFVKPFRQHHLDPKDITRHDFVETNGNSCVVAVPVLCLLLLFMPRTPGSGFYAGTVLASAALFVFCTNQFHKWAHADWRPLPVRWLQRAGLILSPQHHQIHHGAPHDKYYCITVGWMNPLLTRLRFFRACEWVMARVRPDLLHLGDRRP